MTVTLTADAISYKGELYASKGQTVEVVAVRGSVLIVQPMKSENRFSIQISKTNIPKPNDADYIKSLPGGCCF